MADELTYYRVLADIMTRMKAAAAAGEWDQLVELEQGCREQVALLQTLPPGELSSAEKAEKIAIIKQLMADDKEIRSRTERWMQQLARIMQSAKSEQRLQQTYEAD